MPKSLPSITIFLILCSLQSNTWADLYQYRVRTCEWLVDNSEVIAVYRGQTSQCVLTLKGDPTQVSFPLQNWEVQPGQIGRNHLIVPKNGTHRLLYVRGDELLDSVGLGRERRGESEDNPQLYEILYGVTEFGDAILTQQDLMNRIKHRVKSGPGTRLKPTMSDIVDAPRHFFLESSDRTYQLYVPFTESRRDHYVGQLQNGTMWERVEAVRQLAYFDDDAARNAIRDARPAPVPSFQFFPHEAIGRVDKEDLDFWIKNAVKSFPDK